MEIMIELLSHPDHIGVAAHTLANDAGAEQIDLSGSIHSRPRFEPLDQQASEYEAAIKRAIDVRLRQHNRKAPRLAFRDGSTVSEAHDPAARCTISRTSWQSFTTLPLLQIL